MVLYILFGIMALLLVLLLAATVNALLLGRKQQAGEPIALAKGDSEKYASKLSALVQCATVSNSFEDYKGDIYAFHKIMQREFPLFFKTCAVTDLEGSLLCKWSGNGTKPPILLMAHQDVVEASGNWTHPPFSGAIADGRVWGRGTLDCKNNLAGLCLAAEELMETGFVPERDIYFAFGDSEEIGGPGATRIANRLREQGLSFEMILDEGGAILEKPPFPGLAKNYAVIGIMEKGHGNFKFTAKSRGGHSSTPPKNTPIARLAAFVEYVEKREPMTVEITKPVRDMFRRMVPGMPFLLRLVLGNLWLFGGILKKLAPKISPEAAAMLRTTCVFTMMEGSRGYNVIPESAYVTANLRFMVHENMEQSFQKLKRIAEKFDLEIERVGNEDEASPVSDISTDIYRFMEDAISRALPVGGVAPYVCLGGTDARFYYGLSPTILRFGPFLMDSQQYASTHGIDENIHIDSFSNGVSFYKYIMQNI